MLKIANEPLVCEAAILLLLNTSCHSHQNFSNFEFFQLLTSATTCAGQKRLSSTVPDEGGFLNGQ
jgi:hypothetical protein